MTQNLGEVDNLRLGSFGKMVAISSNSLAFVKSFDSATFSVRGTDGSFEVCFKLTYFREKLIKIDYKV